MTLASPPPLPPGPQPPSTVSPCRIYAHSLPVGSAQLVLPKHERGRHQLSHIIYPLGKVSTAMMLQYCTSHPRTTSRRGHAPSGPPGPAPPRAPTRPEPAEGPLNCHSAPYPDEEAACSLHSRPLRLPDGTAHLPSSPAAPAVHSRPLRLPDGTAHLPLSPATPAVGQGQRVTPLIDWCRGQGWTRLPSPRQPCWDSSALGLEPRL